MPEFSIITPSLNQGEFLPECLSSVNAAAVQVGGPVEHLVVDGGSSDCTLSILGAQHEARWVSGPDGGQTDAINRGLANTTGGIVSYLCADDLLEPKALALVRNAFATTPKADVVYGDGYFLENGWKRRKRVGEFSATRLRRGNFLLQPSVFLRRSVWQKFGAFDASLHFCMDHEYWLRICADTRWVYVPEPLACCRLHAGAKTWSQLPSAWDEARRMQARYGIRWRPLRDSLWMRTLGCHFYRMKRQVIARMAATRKLP
jgi:glycosyltransferase involved in cell wall biosynthesis